MAILERTAIVLMGNLASLLFVPVGLWLGLLESRFRYFGCDVN